MVTKKVRYVLVHKFANALSLVAFLVVIVGGLMAGVSFITITWRAFVVMLMIFVVTRLFVRAWAAYEEGQSG